MKKMKQRILSYILVGLLVLGMFPVQAFAAEPDTGDVQEMIPLSDELEEDKTAQTMEESKEKPFPRQQKLLMKPKFWKMV